MKISFDFDDTLSRKSVQNVAKELIARGDELHIVTSRYEDSTRWGSFNLQWAMSGNKDLFRVTDHLGIKRENIHFMDMQDKTVFFLENPDFIVHIDDNKHEFDTINSETTIPCVLCDAGQEWQKPFRKITNLLEVQENVD